jgi:hypothetical protein
MIHEIIVFARDTLEVPFVAVRDGTSTVESNKAGMYVPAESDGQRTAVTGLKNVS